MSRLFTFGCSFTQYGWPTWADIIAYDKDVEYYNYAVAGLGNVGIAHRILEADLKHKFRDGDEIFILWTSWSREDRVKNTNWFGAGSVLTHNNPNYNKSFLKNHWDFDNDVVKNSTAIITTNRLFKNFITWQASSFEFFTNEGANVSKNKVNSIIKLYKTELPNLKVIPCETKNPFKIVHDSHPDVLGHLDIANQIYKDLNLTIKTETNNTFTKLQNNIEYAITNTDNFQKVLHKINNIMRLNYKKIHSIRNFHSLHEDWHIS
jgi:hypothetical protein